MIVTLLTGCGNKVLPFQNKNTYSSFPDKLSAEKIATIDMNGKTLNVSDGGIYYRSGDKYGVMTFDGKHDTGAVYSYCVPTENFFMVVSNTPTSNDMAIENMNIVGVIDAAGKVIVPEEYASIEVLNERYIKVCEVTEQTDSKDDALVFYSDNQFAVFASDDDTFFKGVWYVYDVTNGRKLEGISGTEATPVSDYGNYISYYNEAGDIVYVNSAGKTLPDEATLFDDGSYAIVNSGTGVVFDSNDKKLFEYSTGDYELSSHNTGTEYYTARKYIDNETKYMAVNQQGEVVSAQFEENFSVYGEYVFSGNKLYDFEGKAVLTDEYSSVSCDMLTAKAFALTSDNDDITVIDNNGNVLAEFASDDDIYFSRYDFTVSNDSMYYSYKDKNYTLKGTNYGPWVVETRNEGGTANLIDTISGETLLSNYFNYADSVTIGSSFYAFGENEDGTVDVFIIQ